MRTVLKYNNTFYLKLILVVYLNAKVVCILHLVCFSGNVLSAGPKKRRPYLLKRRANTTGNLKDKDDNGKIYKYIFVFILLQ